MPGACLAVPKHEAVVGVDLPDNVMSTLSTPNTEGGPCVCRLTERVGCKFITRLDVGPGRNLYCRPAHLAIHERDNAVSFACWRSEPNRVLRILKQQARAYSPPTPAQHFPFGRSGLFLFQPVALRAKPIDEKNAHSAVNCAAAP